MSDVSHGQQVDRDPTGGGHEGEDRPVEELPTPPGPDRVPVLGNVLSLSRDPQAFYDELSTYGDVVSYAIPRTEFVAMLHPDHVERVLLGANDSFGKWGFEDFGGEFASEGLLLTEGEQWRRQRTAIQSVFTPRRIESYADAMARYAEELVDEWADGETVTLNRAFSELSLRILAHTLFDVDLDGGSDVVSRFTSVISDRADVRNLSAFVPMWVPTPGNRRYRRALAEFRAFVEELVDERRGREGEYDDLLSQLLTAEGDDGKRMSDVELRDQMITFLFAGHETTSLALTYAFLELAKRDDVREHLDAEHESVLGGQPPGLDDVGALAYTERVIEETLRLYPPALIIFREAREDVAVGGYRVPEGTKVSLPQFFVHTDERWYDDPTTFDPDRWTDERRTGRPDYAYFPFGGGPRHCIGMRFAMMELKTVLPTVAQRVDMDLLSDPDPSFSMGTTLRPDEDVQVRVRKR